MIAQARVLFERGGASAQEQGLTDQVQARLLKAMETREAMTRGLEALSAGGIILCQSCTTFFLKEKSTAID